MRHFKWYNLNVYHVMGSWSKSSFSKNTQKHDIFALSFDISYKIYFGEKIGGARHLREKKINPPSMVLGGCARKACWLIAYFKCKQK